MAKGFKIKKHVIKGELGGGASDSKQLLNEIGVLLDRSCTSEIVGPALIRDTKGNFYKVAIEAELVKVSKKEAEEMMSNEGLSPGNIYGNLHNA